MALSFEESKKLLTQQVAAAANIQLPYTPVAANAGIMTLAEEDYGMVAAYSDWTKSDKYDWYDQYSDDKISTIDENKNITVDGSQINISQEENSQFIPFEMPRYYDGFDLMDTEIWIHYLTKDEYHGASKAVNVSYDTATIKFAWLVDGKATHVAGSLKFEIRAIGVNSKGNAYVWKSKTFDKMTVLQSLIDDNDSIVLDDSWVQELVTDIVETVTAKIAEMQITEQVTAAENAATRAEAAANQAESAVTSVLENYYTKPETEAYVQSQIDAIPEVDLTGLASEKYVDDAVANVDVTDQLQNYALKSEVPSIEGLASETYVNEAVKAVDVSEQLKDYALKTEVPSIDGLASETYVNEAVANVDVTDQLESYALKSEVPSIDGLASETFVREEIAKVDVSEQLAGYAKVENVYTQTEIDGKIKAVSDDVATNASSITSLNKAVQDINTEISGIDKTPGYTYEATYGNVENEDGTTSEYMFTLWETEAGKEPSVKSRFQIMGGGSTSSVSLQIAYVEGYATPIVVTARDKAIIKYEFSGKDSAGDTNLDGTASWKVGNRVVATQEVATGTREFDLTEYVNVGDNKVALTITHATGAVATKTWTVRIVDVRLESDFSDTRAYAAGSPVSFSFTPYGGVDKTVHFLLDGKEIDNKTSVAGASGLSDSYSIAAQDNGSHLFEVYMTTNIGGKTIESNHIVKDIIWYDETLGIPVIGCAQQAFTARQYEATNITFTVIDPSTETPNVTLVSSYVNEDGDTIEENRSELTMIGNTHTWQFKTSVIGKHTLSIICGDVQKTLIGNIVDIGIEVSPITTGLVFDFNPVGRSNNGSDRLWTYGDNIAMTVSENFDWVNGGYQIDENGDQCFCIKAGTSAEINYELFGDDAKVDGKQMKLIFKTGSVADSEAVFLSCLSDATGNDKIGLEMKAQQATIYSKADNLPLPYAENRVIEFEFNISGSEQTPPMVMGYEDGVSTRPLVYDDTHDFQQHKDYRKTISLGSPDCDLYIYRFKVYNKSLSDRDILNNFIADARNAEEMIERYDRNQIYQNGILTPEHLAEVCPWLRIIKIEAPRFTTDKDDKVADTTIEFIYKDGDPILDNFVAYDCVHSGQGTSSNNYGPAGRNLDLIMKTYKDYGNQPYIILGDGSQVNKVSLTRNSIPVNYFNIKVNIASSENANNALMAKRYNEFNPYKRPFVREDATEIAKIKDTMEFVNCVVFIKETATDVAHTEFADSNWHLYAIGNVGDSKKTDDTRLTDPDDPYECILEVMDNTLPNSTMPTGKVDEHGAPVYPIAPEEWCEGNSAYDALHADKFDEKKATDKENGLADTYGWRYIYEDGTDEENDAAKAYVEQKWKDFYAFVVTSTDEEFKAHLGDWCVLDSVMYFYLFTLRYTMTDNHAKNSFWHYGKSNDLDSDGNNIRKWDLCFDYDNDTCLGIDNYGRMTYRYGYEEIDYVDGTSDWVWNAPQHVLFLRLRDLFDEELCDLYTRLESLGCWSSTSLINQFDEWQAQFPEELWRLDIERKYIRTYTSSYIDGPARVEFLKERANGRKKHQRAQFEINQEKYMSSKFGGTVASGDDIILRCSVPNTTLAVPANFDVTLIPYSHIYLNVKYNTSPPIRIRAVPGQEYTIKYDSELADIIEIYSASCLKSVGDLSSFYLINGDFSNASKIRELKLGSSANDYNNTNSMSLGLGSNELLNKLDIQNMSGLTDSLDLSGLKNLEELYAYGTNIGGVLFADGGNIHTVEIPDVGGLQMKNLSYLNDDGFDAPSYNKLSRLVAENSVLDLIKLINAAPNLYQVRLTGIDWKLEDTALLERLYEMAGVTNTGGNTDRSVLSGVVFVPTIKEQQLKNYRTAWPDLTINYNTMVNQFAVTFLNPDGRILDLQYVDKGSKPVDPTTRADSPIAIPTMESTVSTDYTFVGWDRAFVDVFENITIYATYSEAIRQYTITYQANENILQQTVENYGTVTPYVGELPTYTVEEGGYKFYLFSHWDQSGYVNGDKIINAVFDSCEYISGYFVGKTLSNMRPVEVYMLTKLSASGVVSIAEYVAAKDSITLQMGSDYTFTDIQEVVLIDAKTEFTGSNYVDTGIALMEEDRDFVLAIDCKFDSGNSTNAVLAQCFSGLDTSGFKLFYNGGVKMAWGSSSATPITANNRDMLVLRHVKGENGIHVYASNTAGSESYYLEMDGVHSMVHNVSLVFGCSKLEDGSYEQFAKGTVYWSKLWYADLGDAACKKLAYWTHDQMRFEACFEVSGTPKRYYLSDNSGARCSIALISSGVLAQPVIMDTSSTNAGGYAEYELNPYLNTRVYEAFQDDWRQLFKKVKIRSSIGSQSTETSSSDCYIFPPSIGEMYGTDHATFNDEPFISEGTAISHFVGADSRICHNSDGKAVQYWTRSPSLGWSSYVYRVTTTGANQPVTQLNMADVYARIMIAI